MRIQINANQRMKDVVNDLARLRGMTVSELMLTALAAWSHSQLTPESEATEAASAEEIFATAKKTQELLGRAIESGEFWRAEAMREKARADALAKKLEGREEKRRGGKCQTTKARPPRPSKASQTRPAVN